MKCITDDAASAIRSACRDKREDYQHLYTELAALEVSTIVAKEFWYHETCRCLLLKKIDPAQKAIKNAAFLQLKEYIQASIIENGQIIKMNDLITIYKNLIKECDEEEVGLKAQNLKERLKNHFGEKLNFWAPKGKVGIVYSEETPVKEKSLYEVTTANLVKDCAELVRKEIINLNNPFPNWPPTGNEVLSCKISIPKMLEELLLNIISSTNEKTPRKMRLINSIGQDLIYAATGGEKKTLKHIQLGVSIKRKTGSRNVIEWLNRLGHSISYKEVNVIETFFAEEQSNLQEPRKYLPNNIQPSTMVTFVYDNCDHNAESIYGFTLHATNGIIIQKTSTNTSNNTEQPSLSSTIRQKRDSFKPTYSELIPYIKSKKKDNPTAITDVDENNNNFIRLISEQEDKIWYLSRYKQSNNLEEMKTIPSWKGFFQLVSPQYNTIYFTTSYLPSINDSPTKYEVVQEILLQCKAKAEALDLDVADLVLDHAIYCKALEILLKEGNESLKSFINLRMGGFHASCNFLAVIGKRFGDAGLKDLIIESGLLGEGSVDQVLKGKHYNNAMRVHYAVAEAFTRKKIESFNGWLNKQQSLAVFDNFMSSNAFINLQRNPNLRTFQTCMSEAEDAITLFRKYESEICDTERSPMASFWQSYLEMFELLMTFQKSIKSGNWLLHLDSCEKLLPWFHAYDHHNYARHFSYYWATQQQLPITHPTLHQEFVNGNFAINRTPGSFNRISPDQAIEQTINKDQKGSGKIEN